MYVILNGKILSQDTQNCYLHQYIGGRVSSIPCRGRDVFEGPRRHQSGGSG